MNRFPCACFIVFTLLPLTACSGSDQTAAVIPSDQGEEEVISILEEPIWLSTKGLKGVQKIFKWRLPAVEKIGTLAQESPGEKACPPLSQERVQLLEQAYGQKTLLLYTVREFDQARSPGDLFSVIALPNSIDLWDRASIARAFGLCNSSSWQLLTYDEHWILFGKLESTRAFKDEEPLRSYLRRVQVRE